MKKCLASIILVFVLAGCSSTVEPGTKALVGSWEWVESSGGLAGTTTSPSSTASSRQIVITATTIQYYLDGSLLQTDSYSIQTKKSIFGGDKQMLVYESGRPSQSFEVDDNKLFLNDECNDCYQSEYDRK
ncbi:hypothetical protein [Flavobacterium muglaense]|uniref:Lipocalin-like domain-containing protein n=1 Tax=Flavobacterium muglaense TaxID=2764716 RepID=A0A923MYH0_9FLAO|nr:hypothetical protein [Flavobacterium muglaense]MBC5837433.1 hypothetical protein [Flavobacterium muglaense]MBC5843961.1 hypothetical protein [Flavobacterium muglaense]